MGTAHQGVDADVLVVGGGGAACRAALEADRAGARVLLAAKGSFGSIGVRGAGSTADGVSDRGGIACAYDNGQSSVPGLYAAGERAAGMHGANRMAGHMLGASQISGALAGRHAAARRDEPASAPAAATVRAAVEEIGALRRAGGGERPAAVQGDMLGIRWG